MVNERWENIDVEDISSVDKRLGSRIWKLGESGDGLLRRNVCTNNVDIQVSFEIVQLKSKRLLGRSEG